MIKIIKLISIAIGAVLLILALLILYAVFTDYKPEKLESAIIYNESDSLMDFEDDFTVTTFNIGYSGLDETKDFFMDGGVSSKSTSEEKTRENLKGITDFLEEADSDFYALQEVDVDSARSYSIDQVSLIADLHEDYNISFSYNYRVKYVPVPFTDPMGHVNSGIMTLSRYKSSADNRYSLPGKETFPRRYFMLDRCIMETITPLSNGKELILVNLHLSAFDKGGSIRAQQVDFLINYIKEKKKDDNYIILAGDWNHLLSKSFLETYKGQIPEWVAILPDEIYDLGFTFAIDESVNTIRATSTPYEKGKSFETVIDGFLISDNLEVLEVKGHDLGFVNSDHNPVSVRLKFKDK